MTHFDIAIIGSRLAAASALITLGQKNRQGLTIALVAPEQPQTTRSLVGESLPSTVEPLLRELNIWPEFIAQAYPNATVSFTCWDSESLQSSHANQNSYGFGWCIDRQGFEHLLWQPAKQTPFTRFNHVYERSEPTADGWQLHLSNNTCINARFVIDCTGRAASFAKQQGQRQQISSMIAVCDFLSPLNQEVARSHGVMIEAVEQGWWYSSLLPGGRLSVAYFTHRPLLAKNIYPNPTQWQQPLPQRKLRQMRAESGGFTTFCQPTIHDASASGLQRAGDNNGLARGDAAMTLDPIQWKQLLAQSRFTQMRVESGEFAPFCQPTIHDASTSCLQQVGGTNWLACGDAAMALDPLSAHGMTSALWSARKGALAASAALNDILNPLRQYISSCEQNWQLYCQQRTDIYAKQQRFKDSLFWREV